MAISQLVCRDCGAAFQAKRTDAFRCPTCRAKRQKDGERYEKAHRNACADCGKPCTRKSVRCRQCDNRIRNGLRRGPLSPSWKGGRGKTAHGYIQVLDGDRRVLEHRYIWEQANGPIPDKWVVHHFNGIKTDNRLENLVAMPRSHHGPRAHIDPSAYEARIRELEARIRELEGNQDV